MKANPSRFLGIEFHSMLVSLLTQYNMKGSGDETKCGEGKTFYADRQF